MTNEETTILLVDDDEDFLFHVKTFLKSRGYQVETAESRVEAETLLGSVTPDLAVVDLMMDEMDAGFTLSHTIKSRFAEVPVILCTGVTSETGMKFDASASWVKADAMQQAADKYFASWEASQAGYGSEELRAKSEARLAETKNNYAKIFEAGRKAGEDFDGFISKMDDQIRFLGQDLNPYAIAELSDEAAELNGQADTLFSSITETLKTATSYTDSLKPQ